DFLAFGRREGDQAAVPAVEVGPERLFDHGVDLVVGMDRVMVVKGELASLRLARYEEGEVESRVAPADLVAILLPAELGVVDDQVGAPAPLDVLVVEEALQRLRRAAGRLAGSPRRE